MKKNKPPQDADERERDPMVHIRLSPSTSAVLDAVAQQNDRSRNAEVVARLEADAERLWMEKTNPKYAALLAFLELSTEMPGAMATAIGTEHQGTFLALLRATMMKVLDELGADVTEATAFIGTSAGANFMNHARQLTEREAKMLTDRDKKIRHAAKLWGLEPKKDGEK